MAVTVLLVAEYIAPVLQQQAEGQRSIIRTGRSSLLQGKGLWSNAGTRFFNVRNLEHGRIPSDIDYFEFTPEGKLVMYAHADRADLGHSREWSLINVHKKTWSEKLQTENISQLDMGPFWKKSELPLISLSTSAMSVSSLYFYAKHLKATHQRSERINLAFWQKAMMPLAILSMVSMAIPIGATSTTQRTSNLAMRLAMGAVAGILLYLGSQVLQTSGLAMGAAPWVLTSIPVVVIGIIALLLFRKMV
jgi:lipopolysaccharide export system permease protein